jgi:hypothetical protein
MCARDGPQIHAIRLLTNLSPVMPMSDFRQ